MDAENLEFHFLKDAKPCSINDLRLPYLGDEWTIVENEDQSNTILTVLWNRLGLLSEEDKAPYISIQKWLTLEQFPIPAIESDIIKGLALADARKITPIGIEGSDIRCVNYILNIDGETWEGGILWKSSFSEREGSITSVSFGYTNSQHDQPTREKSLALIQGLTCEKL